MANQNTILQTGQSVTTTDATVTTLSNYQTKPGKAYFAKVDILGLNTALTQAAGYRWTGAFFTTAAGVLAQVGASSAIGTAVESNAAWDSLLEASGTEIRTRVTGAAATTIVWRGTLDIVEVGLEPYGT